MHVHMVPSVRFFSKSTFRHLDHFLHCVVHLHYLLDDFCSVLLTQDILGSSTDEDKDSGVHGTGSGGAHGMRDDGVGIGDIVNVQGWAGGAGLKEGGGDSRSVIGDTGVVDGR